MRLRPATAADVDAIAAIHADNWRREYRGIYPDDFLDHEVGSERLALWTERLRSPVRGSEVTVAEDAGPVVAFVRLLLDDDPEWGSHVSNLHVGAAWRRRGLGSLLLAHVASAALERGAHPMLHLWVLAENREAQRFYDARGGERADTRSEVGPGGAAVAEQRYVWRDPRALIDRGGTPPRA